MQPNEHQDEEQQDRIDRQKQAGKALRRGDHQELRRLLRPERSTTAARIGGRSTMAIPPPDSL